MTAYVDLSATLRLPRSPDEEAAGGLADAAVAGGFGVVVVSARGAEAVDVDSLNALRRALEVAPGVTLVPALSPLHGTELADISSMSKVLPRGSPLVLRLRGAVDDALLLRRVGDIARGLKALVVVPSHDAALMRGAVAVEGAVSTRLGLPAVPEASEQIAVSRIIEVARLTGARFHIAGLFTAAGAALVEANAALVSGSVFASHLLFDESALLAHRYDTRTLAKPPLPTSTSRQALLAAVKRGALSVSSGHHAIPKRERDLEMTRSTPGMSSLASTATLLSSVLSPSELSVALSTLPARALGIDPPAAPVTTTPKAVDDDLARLARLIASKTVTKDVRP